MIRYRRTGTTGPPPPGGGSPGTRGLCHKASGTQTSGASAERAEATRLPPGGTRRRHRINPVDARTRQHRSRPWTGSMLLRHARKQLPTSQAANSPHSTPKTLPHTPAAFTAGPDVPIAHMFPSLTSYNTASQLPGVRRQASGVNHQLQPHRIPQILESPHRNFSPLSGRPIAAPATLHFLQLPAARNLQPATCNPRPQLTSREPRPTTNKPPPTTYPPTRLPAYCLPPTTY